MAKRGERVPQLVGEHRDEGALPLVRGAQLGEGDALVREGAAEADVERGRSDEDEPEPLRDRPLAPGAEIGKARASRRSEAAIHTAEQAR